jgi:hypothetical protein
MSNVQNTRPVTIMLVSKPSFIERHYLLAQSEWNKHETAVLTSFKTDRPFPQIFTPRNSAKISLSFKPSIPHHSTWSNPCLHLQGILKNHFSSMAIVDAEIVKKRMQIIFLTLMMIGKYDIV